MKIVYLLILSFMSLSVSASPQRFDFVFSDPGSAAEATGYIVFESTLIPNPTQDSDNFPPLPDPSVLDLEVTVTGSASGDGTFTLSDFSGYAFATNGVTLDLSRDLVGQSTNGGTWGTPDGSSGDFNLFGIVRNANNPISNYNDIALRGGSSAPSGVFYFTLAAGNSGENMVLSSFVATSPTAVPGLSTISLLILSLLIIGFFMVLHNRKTI